MYDKILWIIASYYCDLKQPSYFDKAKAFKMKSTARWSTMELYNYILENTKNGYSPISAIEDFISIMDEFGAESKKNSDIFYTAADITRDIYEIVLASI